uniref:Uncharacterized protein n=1 Tax=Salmonella sp. TaxID=599 RepID=A0A482EW96_SALSP|nr:hypothetical protein NNIBIDOC_00243 [Salmonella sp.]
MPGFIWCLSISSSLRASFFFISGLFLQLSSLFLSSFFVILGHGGCPGTDPAIPGCFPACKGLSIPSGVPASGVNPIDEIFWAD